MRTTEQHAEWIKNHVMTSHPDSKGFEPGDKVIYTNSYGEQFTRTVVGFTILGHWFADLYGNCVYLDNDSFWFPVNPDSLVKA